jgi:glucose/arabinose dehydrogenase
MRLPPAALLLAVACGTSQAASPAISAECQLVSDRSWGPAGTVPIRVERVVSGLEVPWGIAFLPGGDLLVTERPGRIRLVRRGVLVAKPVATVEAAKEGEGGLLGIALHPRFSENRRFFLYYGARAGSAPVNRIAEWSLGPDGLRAKEERIVVDGIAAARYHDGGRLRIGPDGMLYAGTGDATDPPRSQDRSSLEGKVLRIDPSGRVPADNPFPGSLVFLWGVRNVQAFAWRDPATLLVADHGPSGELGRSGHDEVTVAHAGANLGWPDVWSCGARPDVTSASIVWERALPPGGAAWYTGGAIPGWKDSLLVGSLGARHLHRIVFDPAAPARVALHEVYLQGDPPGGLGRIRDVIQGPDGAIWVTTSNCDGRGTCGTEKDGIFRIVAR